MLSNRFARVRDEFVIIDSQFPQKSPMAFRNTEINEYLRRIRNSRSYTMYRMQPGEGAWFTHGYGMDALEFEENKDGYLKHYPQNKDRLRYLRPDKKYEFKLAYSFFLAETYVLLPFYERHHIPFIFVLYPGGSFGLNNSASDEMLGRIFQSEYFREVIVTQELTKRYLIDKSLCDEKKITYIYGGFVQFRRNNIRMKKIYKKDKGTFDICFVAAKYSEKGLDKGYDIFIETAKRLSRTADDIIFHVIGGFDEHEIDVTDIKSRIKFYGYRSPDFLKDFYSKMDIFLGPGRPFELYEGNFDGFPLGIDASYCGVALFVADELKMNRFYRDDKDIVIVPLDPEKIADKILYYYRNLDKLYALSEAGERTTRRLFDIDRQINERIKVFSKYVDLELVK